jgi:hypothetical protein
MRKNILLATALAALPACGLFKSHELKENAANHLHAGYTEGSFSGSAIVLPIQNCTPEPRPSLTVNERGRELIRLQLLPSLLSRFQLSGHPADERSADTAMYCAELDRAVKEWQWEASPIVKDVTTKIFAAHPDKAWIVVTTWGLDVAKERVLVRDNTGRAVDVYADAATPDREMDDLTVVTAVIGRHGEYGFHSYFECRAHTGESRYTCGVDYAGVNQSVDYLLTGFPNQILNNVPQLQ